MWRTSFERRRCLNPITQWAEVEGAKGKMTRTWYSLQGIELFAVAGLWRAPDEWGQVYSMVMVDGWTQMADVHDHMPAILKPQHYDLCTNGAAEDAQALVRTSDDTVQVDRSTIPWAKQRPAESDGILI